jgi:hypothetical protein
MHRHLTTSNAFSSTFAVFPNTQSQPKNCKRATKQTHNNPTKDSKTTTEKKGEGITAVWRNGGFSASYDSLVVVSSAVLRLNFCVKNPPLRQAANR